MHTLNAEALEALENLSDLEKKYCLNMVDRLKNMGLHAHSSKAVCAVASAQVMPTKN